MARGGSVHGTAAEAVEREAAVIIEVLEDASYGQDRLPVLIVFWGGKRSDGGSGNNSNTDIIENVGRVEAVIPNLSKEVTA